MAFTAIGSLVPYGGPVLRRDILANSITVTVMDSVKYASGFVALDTAGASVLGHVNGITTFSGVGSNTSGAAGADIGSFQGSFTTASNNQTVAKYSAEVDVSMFTLYSATLNATIGTTTGSNLAGYRMDLSSASVLNESTAATTTAQYGTFGVDPVTAANAVVNVLESSLFNPNT